MKWINHICNIMSKRHNILPTKTSFFISSAGKIEVVQGSKWNFSSNCFMADGSHLKIVWLHVVAFREYDFLHFQDNVNLLKHYPVKVSQNCFCSFNCSNQTGMQVSESWFALDKSKTWFKVFVNCRNKSMI